MKAFCRLLAGAGLSAVAAHLEKVCARVYVCGKHYIVSTVLRSCAVQMSQKMK
jgi:hypothetical protein